MKRFTPSVLFILVLFVSLAAFGQGPVPPTGVHAVVVTRTTPAPEPKMALGVKVSVSPVATVSLTCTPPSSGTTPTSYNFYRSTVSGTGATGTPIGSSATCAYSDTTVAYSTTYFYVATAVNANPPTGTCPVGKTCESVASNQATAVIPANPIPNPPTGLTSTVAVALNWQPPTETVNAYVVYRRLTTNPNYTTLATVSQPNFIDVNVPSGTYYYRVRALVTQNGQQVFSGWSNLTEIKVN